MLIRTHQKITSQPKGKAGGAEETSTVAPSEAAAAAESEDAAGKSEEAAASAAGGDADEAASKATGVEALTPGKASGKEIPEHSWVVLPNKAYTPQRSVLKCLFKDVEVCKKKCLDQGWGAFSVIDGQATFCTENAPTCKDGAKDSKNGTLYLCYVGDERLVAPVSPQGKKKSSTSFMSWMFGSSQKGGSGEGPSGISILKEDIDNRDDAWYNHQLNKLSKDGINCTKVGTNGKPYDRRILLDARNMQIEIRGGRSGTTGIMLDDLVDLRKGFASVEFTQFIARVKEASQSTDLAERSLVLQTPHRTISLLFSSANTRTTVGHCMLFLLRSKNRGLMAKSHAGGNAVASKGPKQGHGTATYPNKSSYTGEFMNHMRHGKGTLTLSDGTLYEAEWRNDERHGQGKEFVPDGTLFVGSYVKGMRHGQGVMTWPEGSKYSGQFENGRANGQGELLRTDGSIYKGEFQEDCMSGEGVMKWPDGVQYTGQFVANRREGFGRMQWTSGRWKSYEGRWNDGMQHDRGTLCDHDGGEFKGIFKAGKLERWEEQ